ncbi:SDR family oxidoreductase [Dehalococcoidia bacterium]|nr:SDR family oxidoreductase [Dehalococcoidia bacterium]
MNIANRLYKKVAIVTGSATGMGRAAAVLFAKEGARVVVVDRNFSAAEDTLQLIRNHDGEAIFVQTDVSKGDQVQAMVQTTLDNFGQLDTLVNAAGILIRTPPLAEVSELDWDLTLDTNLRGVFFCCKYAIPHMMKRGGSIINVSSTAGIRASVNYAPYGVSKAGIIQLTQTASREYAGCGIRANVIIPGLIDTPQSRGSTGSEENFQERITHIPLGRAGTPDDVAYLMLYLASDESSYATGATFVIDGGRSVL